MALNEWIALLMFAGMFVMLSIGYPVAFSFAATAMLFAAIGSGLGVFELNLLRALPSRFFGTMSDFTLLAIPYFVFMGLVLEKSGIAERLLETIGILFGPIRGGVALAVVLVGTLLAATTGVVAASVIAMGMISLPVMLRYNYNKELACGVIAASGTLAQLIPPSLVLIVLADQMGVSIGDLFRGALLPGLLMSGSFAAYVLVLAYLRPEMAPALPLEARDYHGRELALKAVNAVVPPLALIFIVLGSIFTGFATPTESGAVGVFGACLLALAQGKLSRKMLWDCAAATMRTTGVVVIILFGSTIFSLVFTGLDGDQVIARILTNLPGGYVSFMIVSMIAVFLLGIFLEFFEISFIVVPLFLPVIQALGLDPVWFAVVLAVNLQTAFVSPPVGFSLFYLRSVAPPSITAGHIYRGGAQFMAIQLLVLLVVILYPPIVTGLAGN